MTNIVLLVVDTLRNKELEMEGDRVAPFLNSVSNRTSIKNYYSCSPWTAPAHASIFSSKLPSEHGTTTRNPYFEDKNILVNFLGSKDFETICLSENGFISKSSGYGESFDIIRNYSETNLGGPVWKEIWNKDSEFNNRLEKWSLFLAKSMKERDKKSISAFFRRILEKSPFGYSEANYNPRKTASIIKDAKKALSSDENTFLFLNLMPVHDPYTFNEEQRDEFLPNLTDRELEEASQLHHLSEYLSNDNEEVSDFEARANAYKASINYVDSKIEELYNQSPENTCFIVLGDHGELIGEYEMNGKGLVCHQLGTFKEVIDVPCIIFSKNEELQLDIDQSKLYDHRDMNRMIAKILGEKPDIGREEVRAEYFGLRGLAQHSDREIPSGTDHIFDRKSFSLITEEIKYDVTSDGEYAWPRECLTEDKKVEIGEVPDSIVNKAKILYSHNFGEKN